MCGIVGYLGHEPAAGHILTGLRTLQYRGYDSAGLAVLGPEGIGVRRRAGRLHDLEALVQAEPVERHHRHRPHTVGDAWRGHRCECASPR